MKKQKSWLATIFRKTEKKISKTEQTAPAVATGRSVAKSLEEQPPKPVKMDITEKFDSIMKHGRFVYETKGRSGGMTYCNRVFAEPDSPSNVAYILVEDRFLTGHDDSATFVELINENEDIIRSWEFEGPLKRRFTEPSFYDDDCLVFYLKKTQKCKVVQNVWSGYVGQWKLLTDKDTKTFPDGSTLKTYQIEPGYTAEDCLKMIVRNPNVQIQRGEREAEHDVGCGSSGDYEHYSSVDAFFASGDYARYAGATHMSCYSFFGRYRQQNIELRFADQGIMTLYSEAEGLDLRAILEEAE